MNQTIGQMIGLFLALWLLVACQEDTLSGGFHPGDGMLRLSGVNAQQVQVDTRANGIKGFFPEDTHYRILMEGDADGDGIQYNPELRFSDVGRDVASGSQHFIRLLSKQDDLRFGEKDVVNFYGLTDPAIQKEDDNSAEYKGFVADYLPVEDFQYNLMASEEDGKYTLPDLRSAVSTNNSLEQLSYVIPLHFKHILSKVNFEIVQQVAEGSEGGLFGDLTLEGLSVSGQPTVGKFNLKENCFTKLTGPEDYPVSLKEDAASIPITITPQEVGSILLFPMTAKTLDKTNMLKVEVTLGGEVETLEKFGKDVKDDDEDGKGSLTLTCPVYANNPAGEGTGTTPLRLLPNYEYDLQFVIMSNEVRIITIVPRVYEWLDGETDKKTPEDGYYEEQDLGQPLTFNGVVWSDRNLGASSAHPLRSIDDWRKSVGYYYQFNRNIPYFPNDYKDGKIDLKTDLATALYDHRNNRRPLYPVVNFTAWGEDNYPERKFIAPASGNDDWYYISRIGEKGESNNCWSFLTNHERRHKIGLWQNKETQPCPKGWRLPTYDDFKGILPGSAFSGNITFRMLNNHADNGGWRFVNESGGDDNNNTQELNFPEMFKPGGKGMELRQTELPGTRDWNGDEYKTDEGEEVAYLGEFPCLFRCEVDDPLPGRKSQYILSMHEEDWQPVMDKSNKYREDDGFIFNWGTIYAIKNQGTAQAYRIKWEVKLVGGYEEKTITETTPDIYQGKKAHVYNGVYGVLVISRYTANEYDKFEPDGNGSFVNMVAKEKWANPVEVMYLPICGVGGSWNGGTLYNIGTETWYATSEYFETDNKKGMVWLKLLGDNKNNQGFFYEPVSPMYDLLSIRPVRDN